MIGLREWLETAPPGTLVRTEEVLARLDTPEPESIDSGSPDPTPAERLWSCPDQTRYTVADLSAALQRPKSFVYGLARSGCPHLKLDRHLVFIAKEVRIWIASREERIVKQKSVPITTRSRRTA